MDNYALQAAAARRRCLTYDQDALIRKFHLQADKDRLYWTLLSRPYRIGRQDGRLEKKIGDAWVPADSHGEIMTLFDILCDAADNRSLSGQFQLMENFGHGFHRSLAEDHPSPEVLLFDREPEVFIRGCEAMGGVKAGRGDLSYRTELADGLPVLLEFWHSDEDFPPQLKFFWDLNSLQYLKYETMWYAAGLILERITESL